MKTSMLCVVLILLLCATESLSQNCDGRRDGKNIAFNGDFEQTYGTCTSDVGYATASKGALGWNGVPGNIDGRTFYLNSCSPPGTYDPLDNVYGTQEPLNGDGYFTIVAGPLQGISPVEEAYEGYIAHELITPLVKSITYYIEFSVSLADVSTVGVKSLGMYLTHNVADLSPASELNYHNLTPQIPNNFPSPTAYLNYNGWVKICGYYTPTVDGVKYLVIGRFRNEPYEYSGTPGYNSQTLNRPVYYVDGVYIQEYACCPENKYFQNTSSLPAKTSVNNELVAGYNVVALPPGNVNITNGQSVTFQSGNRIVLKPGFNAQTGSNFSIILAPCMRGVDDNQLAVTITVDASVPGQYTLIASASHGSGGYTYRWNTGATTASITVMDDPSLYKVVATDNIPDPSTPPPCNVRVGIGEFITECTLCRQSSVTNKPEVTTTSAEVTSGAYQVYPNPSRGIFTVKLSEDIASYSVMTLLGQVLLMQQLDLSSTREITLDISVHGKGIYLLRTVDVHRKSTTRFIVTE